MKNNNKKLLGMLFVGSVLLAACGGDDPLVEQAMQNGASREEAEDMAEMANELFSEEELSEMTGTQVKEQKEESKEQIIKEEEVFVLTDKHKEIMNAIEQLVEKQAYSEKGLQKALTNVGYMNNNTLKESIKEMNYDWFEMAKKRGEQLLTEKSEKNFSKQNLGVWLRDEGFDHELAKSALDEIDFDWKRNAVLQAQKHINELDFDEEELRRVLVNTDGFTEEEMEYAISQTM